ncbi:MAG: hypothetical protein AB7K36_19610 [Chloroflexota bacterium]
MATTRERIHELLESVPDDRLADAEAAIAALAEPPYRPLSEAPEDDEPLTEEDLAAIAETRAEIARGKTIPHDVAMRSIGL